MKPFVSLIVPVLNVEKYLEQCLTSISDQNYDNFEVILVVGKCSDNSEAICEKWCKKDIRFRTVPQLKACLGYARNVGLDAAKGDYIAFCDSDDCITPDFLSCFVDIALKNDSDIVETQFTLCDENLNPIYDYDRNILGSEMGHSFLEYTSAPSVWKYFVKRAVFTNNNLRYPEFRFGEDISMYSLLFSHCQKIDYVKKPTYLYRQIPSSLMNNPQGKRNRYESLFDIISFVTSEFKERSLFKKSWLKLLFQLEIHSASIIQDSACSDDDALAMRLEISDYLKKSFPVRQTIFDLTAFSWGGEIVSSIASKLSSLHDTPPTTMFNRYFFELLDNVERKKLEEMITSTSPDVFVIDLISEARYLSSYTGDLGTYVKNWKLGFNAFMQIVQIASNNSSVFLLENYLSQASDSADNLSAILKMLYDDIKMNYPEIVCISAITNALQDFNDQKLSCLYQLKQVSDKLHTMYSPAMNCVEVKGGLGNQIFQYVFGKYLEKHTGYRPLLHIGFFDYVKAIPGGTKRVYSLNKIFSNLETTSGKIPCNHAVTENGFISDPDPDVFYRGYWQDIRYFSEVKDSVLEDFYVDLSSMSEDAIRFAEIIESTNSIAMHVRRQDYLNADNINLFEQLTLSYYESAIDTICKQSVESLVLFIFSDDIEYATSIADSFGIESIVVPLHQDYEDMYLMTLARHYIIANSTFSLWGALLSKRCDGITIAPKHWFKNTPAKNLYPKEWLTI